MHDNFAVGSSAEFCPNAIYNGRKMDLPGQLLHDGLPIKDQLFVHCKYKDKRPIEVQF